MINGKFPTFLSFFYIIRRLWRVGPLEVGRPITVTVATTMASGMLEPVPAGGRPNDRDPLALAQGGGRGGRTPGALERWR